MTAVTHQPKYTTPSATVSSTTYTIDDLNTKIHTLVFENPENFPFTAQKLLNPLKEKYPGRFSLVLENPQTGNISCLCSTPPQEFMDEHLISVANERGLLEEVSKKIKQQYELIGKPQPNLEEAIQRWAIKDFRLDLPQKDPHLEKDPVLKKAYEELALKIGDLKNDLAVLQHHTEEFLTNLGFLNENSEKEEAEFTAWLKELCKAEYEQLEKQLDLITAENTKYQEKTGFCCKAFETLENEIRAIVKELQSIQEQIPPPAVKILSNEIRDLEETLFDIDQQTKKVEAETQTPDPEVNRTIQELKETLGFLKKAKIKGSCQPLIASQQKRFNESTEFKTNK